MLIPVDQLKDSEKRYETLVENPVRDKAAELFNETTFTKGIKPEIIKGNILSTDDNLVKRKQMLAAIKAEPVDFAFDRAIGKNDSVYSNFVELIHNAKQKVGRVAIKQGTKNIGFATGFMVSENLMLTNWHVFNTKEDVADSEIQFHYELDVSGNPGTSACFKLQSEMFFHSNKELDYCIVAVQPTDTSGKFTLSEIGYIFLDPALGKLGSEEEEALNIIHHPEGDYMQLSIRENLFVKITPTSIWYKTDTAPGSSGSPVFNDQLQVVALHHMGIGRKNSSGDYVDKDGKVIPMIDGKIDASKVVWDANEGIRISVILNDILTSFPGKSVVNGLQVKPVNITSNDQSPVFAKKVLNPLRNTNTSTMETSNAGNINISFPASLLEKNGVININIKTEQGVVVNQASKIPASSTSEGLDVDEIKKLEETVDFASFKGYQSTFLGTNFNITFPQPLKEIKKFMAKVGSTDSLVLKYPNYSAIFHSVRMMPAISGVNVDGSAAKRLDDTVRKDVWLRDTRLSFDIQLNDNFYTNSGFDRGHMSRREDADWGATADEAKRNADVTCMYTNACPQVPKINQSSRKGLWGLLEKVVLESGVEVEKRSNKISVFNGPMFKTSDPVFRGIQVPMDFYKIILWLTDNKSLKATAFKLSQVALVSDIDFEQLDLDKNTEFKAYQCSINSLQEKTKLNFTDLFPYDTFEGNGAGEVVLTSEVEVKAHIDKHNKG